MANFSPCVGSFRGESGVVALISKNQASRGEGKTLVITGSSGFVGEKLARTAIGLGYSVVGIDLRKIDSLDCPQFVVDIVNESFYELIPYGSTIIHLASLSTDSLCRENPTLAIDANLKGTMRILLGAEERKVAHIIFASSEWVYPERREFSEQYETDPLDLADLKSLYAITKLVGESLFRSSSKIPYTLLRFGIVYGPRKSPGSSAESLALKVFGGEEIKVGSKATARKFIFVDDLVQGILRTAELGATITDVNPINLAGSELISLEHVVNVANSVLKKSTPIIDEGKLPSIRNPMIHRAQGILQWEPLTQFSDGIRKCLEAMTGDNERAKEI